MLQVVRKTLEERYEMYFKCKKKDLLTFYNERLRQRGQKDENHRGRHGRRLRSWMR